MSLPENIAPLLEPISALQRFMDRLGGRGVIIGGVATGFHGKPRLTVDVDAMVLASVDDISKLLILAKEEGIEPRIENVDGFARRNRILLLHHTATKANIDISLGILPFEEEIVERSILHKLGPLSIRLPTPEDLIIMKAIAHRPKDLEDIKTIVEKYPILDVERIKQWVIAFAEALEQPELWRQIERLLKS
jgi:predicted nucleotidyltransferase